MKNGKSFWTDFMNRQANKGKLSNRNNIKWMRRSVVMVITSVNKYEPDKQQGKQSNNAC